MIIIPDIHGRQFWKDAVRQRSNGEEVLFLGDYVDPYPFEVDPVTKNEITPKSALENFEEILDYANDNKGVSLLYGNHDASYIWDMPQCRYDSLNSKLIQKHFNDNKNLFSLCQCREFNGKNFLFSHTCITRGWLEYNNYEYTDNNSLVKYINSLPDTNIDMLNQVGRIRGGWHRYGSCLWADVNEACDCEEQDIPNTYEVFGHTQCKREPIITDLFAMIDCRQGFRLDEATGELKQITQLYND